MITGKHLIQWGLKPGPWFKSAITRANRLRDEGLSTDEIWEILVKEQPVQVTQRTNALEYGVFLDPETEIERENAAAVHKAMDELMRTPTVKSGAIMPDACPAGTIPVGGVVATENAIHPGFHSADVCCSMAISVFKRQEDPKKVLDLIQKVTHFGPTRREKIPLTPPEDLVAKMDENLFLKDPKRFITGHFTTQGDGNHFYYVGHLESTGQLAIVSHHGSRGVGAMLYNRGKKLAQRLTPKNIPKGAAWIPAESREGEAYWEALQLVRLWTKHNHLDLHDFMGRLMGNSIVEQFWNEHNFVFQKSDGLFYHAKGATPSFKGFSEDDQGLTLIPMNMAEPILITQHMNNKKALGFSPHGAGRNMSRTRFRKEFQPVFPTEIDARFWCGTPDPTELPEAYKNAESVISSIKKNSLAWIKDRVIPYGSIMAGDWEKDAPWRNKK